MTLLADAAQALDASTRARLAAACIAVDPALLGGAVVRAPRSDIAEHWLRALRGLLPEGTAARRVPLAITDDRLLGGLDLAMTLAAGRPMAERGLLAAADGGLLIVPCAERAREALVARLSQTMDTGVVPSRLSGITEPSAARFALIALDESVAADGDDHAADERVAEALSDRVAFLLELPAESSLGTESAFDAEQIAAARALMPSVRADDAVIASAVSVAAAFGIVSLRAPSFAIRAARALAALDGRTRVGDEDLATAAVLVLGPRATQVPMAAPAEPEASADASPPPPERDDAEPDDVDDTRDEHDPMTQRELDEMLVRAVLAALPAGLVLDAASSPTRGRAAGGRAGGDRAGGVRGRQVGTRRGDPRAGGRLDLIETLRAAAPWQRLRREAARTADALPRAEVKVQVRPDDFRLRRLMEPAGTTAIFVVDASGSAALHRMAEAKGAVELLLADSYARRDEVALIAFRGAGAEVLLPPTRAIAAAKRALAALPGGGGTPLASAIDRARELALQARRTGNDTVVVFLTDAKANIARDGTPGRPQAEADALASAQALRAARGTALLIDTSPRPSEVAQRMATAMGARYVALPRTDAAGIHAAVVAAIPKLPKGAA